MPTLRGRRNLLRAVAVNLPSNLAVYRRRGILPGAFQKSYFQILTRRSPGSGAKEKMNRRWTQMNIDVKRLKKNWTSPLRVSAPINITL
jgi:hypothetical protein